MKAEFIVLDSVAVNVDHERLITPIIGFAGEGISEYGTLGILIFIPTSSPQDLINLLKV